LKIEVTVMRDENWSRSKIVQNHLK
jgi:hypothetical protein